MWLLMPDASLSVVLADTEAGSGVPDPEHVMVRARLRSHLDRLRQRHERLAEFEVIESPSHCDYRWRIVVPKRVLAEALFDEVMGLGYRNVKSEAHVRGAALGDGYVAALHDVWTRLNRLQDQDPR